MIVTLADYLTHIGETSVSNEAQVKQALLEAQDYAENYCNRLFVLHDSESESPTSHEHTFDGNGRRQLYPPQAPIQSVTTVELWNGDDWEEVDAVTYTPQTNGNKITFREGHVWAEGTENWRVTYVYGFTTVPASLKRAILLIAQAFAGTSVRDSNIKSQSDGEQSFTYFDEAKTSVPAEATDILDTYVRMT